MKVKRLEIQGFKSFKDKTVIHFDHSITGIVGPNGCGKSNIVDAFFWVMGEQSYKHMRGAGSSDLIFNGSTKYQPLGLAEATLVLETDVVDTENAPAGASVRNLPPHLRAKEVAVTRRVYRSGEGEYFINGQPARLKDIQELFMDTGIGAKGYSVIEQGQIGKIVNSKPEERRLLIEEAAGIAKYKARKKESLRKLESAQANLARLTDIIQVMEKGLSSLERQAQKARQYKKYKEELLAKEMTWGRRKRMLLQARLETVKSDRARLEQEVVGLRAEISSAEATAETGRITEQTDAKQAEELTAVINHLSQELTRQQSQLELSRSRQEDLSRQETQLTTEKEDLAPQIQAEEERVVGQEMEATAAKVAFDAAAASAHEASSRASEARGHMQALRQQHHATNQKLLAGFQEASQITAKDASLDGRIESALTQEARIRSEMAEIEHLVSEARALFEQHSEEHSVVSTQRAALAEDRRTQADACQTEERMLKERERARDEQMRKLAKDRSRLQSLEELEAAYEGYAGGPKAALDWARSSGQGELRAVASLLDVQPGFEGTLELWLESHLQDLVASEEGVAVEALAHLRATKKGRATLRVAGAPVAAVASFEEVKAVLEAQGLRVLSDLQSMVRPSAQATGRTREMLDSLLANTCVVEEFGGAVPRLPLGWSLISRDGFALRGDGELRGGTVTEGANAASLLGRKRLIEDLQIQVANGETELTDLEEVIAANRATLEVKRAGLSLLQTQLQELEVKWASLERDLRSAERSCSDLERRAGRFQEDLAQNENAVRIAREEKDRLADRLQWILSERDTFEREVKSCEEKIHHDEATLAGIEQELQTVRVQEASARERSNSISREFDAVRRLLDSRKRRLAELETRLIQITEERALRSGGEPEIEERIGDLHRETAERREALSQVRDRLQETANLVSDFGSRLKELRHRADGTATQSNRAVIEVEKLSSELGFLIQNLEEKYGVGCLDATDVVPEQGEMDAPVVSQEMTADEELLLNEEVERLRERIRRLGEINVNAIEEFETESKGYENLVSQKRDLDHSIQNLQDAITHINKTSEERFKRAFDAIAERFERLFPIIFGGGQAKLSLVYPEGSSDILEAGVDILAQPPGKKIVNIGVLSGGEKALTAVSLIFAIFMVKPSPFCVLDEVDAPLDDANIGKFNALLREMSSKSQFIIITHNKKTMELNDTLYGVTMEEPGVSKMVSIELQ